MKEKTGLITVQGGVCAAKGFTANGIHCGIRKNKDKNDLSLIFSEKKAATACVYTSNLVQGAPIAVTKENIKDGYAQAIICNSGNANTCNAGGEKVAVDTCKAVAEKLKKEGVAVISITHYMEEAVRADRIYVIEEGKIALNGTPKEVFSEKEKLKRIGLEMPAAARVAEELIKRGVSLPQGILTDSELERELCRLTSVI